MARRELLLVLLASLVLASCAPDPRKQAAADRTQALTQQDTLDRVQARGQAAVLDSLQLQEAQALATERTEASRRWIRWTSIAGSLAAFLAIVAAGLGASWGLVGSGRALARLAAVRVNLIPLPEKTRQYPLFLQYIGHGRYMLANPNIGSLTQLDTRKEADRQLITSAGAVQLAGVVSREARRSEDPAGVSVIQPSLVKGGEDEL